MNYEALMELALAEAAQSGNDVPVGALVISASGEIIGRAHNNREITHDPTGHAEIIAIRQATDLLTDWPRWLHPCGHPRALRDVCRRNRCRQNSKSCFWCLG